MYSRLIRMNLAFVCAVALIFQAVACGPSDAESTKLDTPEPQPDSVVVELTGVDSLTVLELLLESHEVEYRGSLSGAFVTAIDGVETEAGYFWIYSVNDTAGTIACDEFRTGSGDRVKWHFRNMAR